MHSPKIVVCGATGNQGGAVAAALLKKGGWSVTALTRDPGSAAAQALAGLGAEVVAADLLEVGSLARAFQGAYGVFCLTQPWSYQRGMFDTGIEIRQGKNQVWACLETGVPEVVYSSMLNVYGNRSRVPYIDSKLVLEDLFARYIPRTMIVRPALYMENIGTSLLRISGDKILGRFGRDAGVPYIALSDIGSSVAELFASPEIYAGTRSLLAGDIVTGHELAFLLSGSLGGRPYCLRIP